MEDALLKSDIKGVIIPATTGTTGNVNISSRVSLTNRIVDTSCAGYIVIPFVSSGAWYVKVLNPATMQGAANTSVDIAVHYI